MRLAIVVLICVINTSFTTHGTTDHNNAQVAIDWVDELRGDFSFNEQWSYAEGVYTNRHGQLSCDGFCPIETDRMKDDHGRLIHDSLEAFYQLVDTTHFAHSLRSEASAYEWSGTDFMTFNRQDGNSILGQSSFNVSTHSSLNIKMRNDSLSAWIEYNSIRNMGIHKFPMTSGHFKIDRDAYSKGIIKAEFDFKFDNSINPEDEVKWSGLIYSVLGK